MTDFVARDATHLGIDRIATSPTAFALYQNLFAFAEKAAGAPVLANGYVTEVMLAANIVGINKMKIGQFGGSSAPDVSTAVNVNQYAFASPAVTSNGNGGNVNMGGGQPVQTVRQWVVGGGSGGASFTADYITASGNPRVWAWCDADGSVIASFETEDPPDLDNPDANPLISNVLAPGQYFTRLQIPDPVVIEEFLALKGPNAAQISARLDAFLARRGLDIFGAVPSFMDFESRMMRGLTPRRREWLAQLFLRAVAPAVGRTNYSDVIARDMKISPTGRMQLK